MHWVREGEWTMWTMANRLYVKSGGACNSGHLEKRKVNFSLQNEKAPDIIELMVHKKYIPTTLI